ncbi:unnamed protein product [Acanthocheilonema viteae]|uniref:7TM GPCR serpentine receptor class x (Srx) domain-containing protein n=1 Tax=Acanthocheilonema viteae TaxID=6277 RepID=A0A498SM42_ACAVI|nr:unnamed protein product [Acanthocheilonema viteae]
MTNSGRNRKLYLLQSVHGHSEYSCPPNTYIVKECSFVFNENSNYRFSYQNLFYGKICAYIDTVVTVGIVMGMACIDFFTLIKIIAYRRAIRKNAAMSTGSTIYKREVMFFKQVINTNSKPEKWA